MSAADEAARTEAAEFIRREMQDGFLHPGIVTPGSRAHKALSTLVTAALEQRPQPIEVTIDEWRETIHAERKRQIEKGYTDEHDREAGATHLIDWAIDYARMGNTVAVAGILLSVRNQLVAQNEATQDQPIKVTDATDTVAVYWYDCECEYVTKFCDENHRRSALVPRSVLRAMEEPNS